MWRFPIKFRNNMEDLRDICGQAIRAVVGSHIAPLSAQEGWKESMLGVLTSPLITPTTNIKYGHYQLNSTMGIAKIIKDLHYTELPSNPAELSGLITQEILRVQDEYTKVKGCPKPIEAVNIAGCFINLMLTPTYLLSKCFDIYMAVPFGSLPKPPVLPKKRIAVDFSSPNVAKSMHVGHLRSTIIGDSISRLYEYVGYDVHRINHVGDWGTQFGMLITYLTDMHPEIADAAAHCRRVTMLPIDNLVAFYKKAKERFDTDADFQKRAYETVVKLQHLNLEEFYLWHKICGISRHEFQRIYDRLDIKIDEFGESYYKFKLGTTVARLKRLHLTQLSDKATVIPVEGMDYPLIIVKSDGGFTYDTTDMAAIYHRTQVLHADKCVYVVDAGQSSHFELVFGAAEKAGWITKGQAVHVPFGVVLGSDGKRLKTRAGETVKLEDLLDEAVAESTRLLEERNRDQEFSQEEVRQIAEAVGYGAVKYADLSSHRIKDYKYDPKRMLNLKGNTAAYLLYSFTRISSICRKAGINREELYTTSLPKDLSIEDPSEINLLVALLKVHDTILFTLDDLCPHRICDWVYSVASAYTDFYEKCRVIETSESGDTVCNKSRLALCEMTRQSLRLAFHLLGIREIDRM